MANIRHIWFDFSETIAMIREEKHNQLRYETYAEVTGKELTPELTKEYEQLYERHKHSNAAIFRSLGKDAGFWSGRVNSVEPEELYRLAEPDIPEVLERLSNRLPISVFSNIELKETLPALGIKIEMFTYMLSSAALKQPKPALDGFYKMVQLSGLPPEQILYIGDNVEKDVLPARAVKIKAGIIYSESEQADYCFKNFREIEKVL